MKYFLVTPFLLVPLVVVAVNISLDDETISFHLAMPLWGLSISLSLRAACILTTKCCGLDLPQHSLSSYRH